MAHAKEDSSAFYLHLVAAHGGTYMSRLRSLEKYMNSGLEASHKMTNEMMTHTQMVVHQAPEAGNIRRAV